MLSNLPNKTVIGGRWETVSLLGVGACAQVYKVRSTSAAVGYDIVAKVIPLSTGKSKANKEQERICNTLNYEYMMYNGLLSSFPHKPRTPDRFYGDDNNLKVRYLIMEQMDRDLVALSRNTKEVNSSLIARLGLQILEGLQWIHQKGFLFIDVKPDNFMLKGDALKFVDFGLVERLQVMPAGQTTPNRQFAGTPTFCSIATQCGEQPGAHDDLEAMGLVLLSLTSESRLPWSGTRSEEECRRTKQACDIKKLCTEQGLPELSEIILACRTAVRTVRPDYEAFHKVLVKMRDRKTTGVPAAGKGKGAAVSSAPLTKQTAATSSTKATTAAATSTDRPLTAAQKRAAAKPAEPAAAEESTTSPEHKKSRSTRSAPEKAAAPELEAAPSRSKTSRVRSPPKPTPTPTTTTTDTASSSSVNVRPTSSSTSPVRKQFRTAVGVSDKPATGAAAVSGPFSADYTAAASTATTGGDPHAVLSPAHSTRSRTSATDKDKAAPTGPFSASFEPPANLRSKTADKKPANTNPPAFIFSIRKGPCKGQELILPARPTPVKRAAKGKKAASATSTHTVGKAPDCDFPLTTDIYLSDRHFQLIVSDGSAFLEDVGSTNGTKLNRTKIPTATWTELSDNDVIKAGTTEILVQFLL